MNASLNDR